MKKRKQKRLIRPLYAVVIFVLVIMIGGLVLTEELDLDPDMIRLSGNNRIQSGVITAIREDGIEVLNMDNNTRMIYRPIIPITEDKNPGLGFAFLAQSHEAGQPVCFLSAKEETSGNIKVAYNFQKCGTRRFGESDVAPGTHQYVSSLRIYATATLIGYKDGTRAGDKGRSQLDKNKFLVVRIGKTTVDLQRATTYGYPNGRYSEEDRGKRYCLAQHEIVNVKFSKDMKPIGLWESSNPGVYLWTCKAANTAGNKSYADLFE